MHLEEINLLTSREKRNGRCAGGGPELNGKMGRKTKNVQEKFERNYRRKCNGFKKTKHSHLSRG
jgi:hypothetical protein